MACIEIQKMVNHYLTVENKSEKRNRKKNIEIKRINDDLTVILKEIAGETLE